MKDLLDIPAGDLPDTLHEANDFDGFESRDYFTGPEFFNYLDQLNGKLWIMSYTASVHTPLYNIGVERLIYCNDCDYDHESQLAYEVKQMKGIHSKLYLYFSQRNKHIWTFVGSQNYVRPSNCNLMVKLNPKFNARFKKYFLHFWNQVRK